MSVGIVGGGLLGPDGRLPARRGGRARDGLRGRRPLGGLAGTHDLDGVAGRPLLPRGHCRPTTACSALAEELGLSERSAAARSASASTTTGRLTSMSTPRELLRFPGLSAERPRAARRVRGALPADRRPRRARRRAAARPGSRELRRAALGAALAAAARLEVRRRYDDLPATYLWSRTRRTAGTRDRAGREVMGGSDGGYQALVDALARRDPRAAAASVLTSTPVRSILSARGRALGVVVDGGCARTTWSSPRCCGRSLEPLLARTLEPALRPDPCRYLGVVCVVARVRRSVSPYYALNITDRRVPAHDRGRDDARRRSRARRRPPALRAALRASRTRPSLRAPRGRDHATSTSRQVRRMFPGLRPDARRAREPGRARPRRRAGPPGRGRGPHPGPVPGAGPRGRVVGARVPGHRARPGDRRRRRAGRRRCCSSGWRTRARAGGGGVKPAGQTSRRCGPARPRSAARAAAHRRRLARARRAAGRADRRRAAAGARAGLFCLALVALTWGTWGDLAKDTGYDLVAAQRIAAGEAALRRLRLLLRPARARPAGRRLRRASARASGRRSRSALVLAAAIVVAHLPARALAGRAAGGAAGGGAHRHGRLLAARTTASCCPTRCRRRWPCCSASGALLAAMRGGTRPWAAAG